MPHPGFVRTRVEMKGPVMANNNKEVCASALLRLLWEGAITVHVQVAFALDRNYETQPTPLYLFIQRDAIVEWDGPMPIDKPLFDYVIKHETDPAEFIIFTVESIGHGAQNLAVENFLEYSKSRKRVA